MAVSYNERMKRGRRLTSIHGKLERKKELLSSRYASPERLQKRAKVLAREILRRKFAGMRGKHYHQLNASQRMAVDRIIDQLPKKKRAELAKRLLPVVTKAEQIRVMAIRKNKPGSLRESFLEEESLLQVLRRKVGNELFSKIRRILGRYIRNNRRASDGAKSRASSRVAVAAATKLSGFKKGKNAYQKHARRSLRLDTRGVGGAVKKIIDRADHERLSSKERSFMKGVSRELRGGRMVLAHADPEDYDMMIYEQDGKRLGELFMAGLVEKKKIAYYKRILKDTLKSMKFQEYHKSIAALLDDLINYVSTDDVIYRRLRFDVLKKEGKNK